MMKQLTTPIMSLVMIATIAGCGGTKYLASDFETKTASHKIVAVMPVEMVFTGKQPKTLTSEQIIEIEEAESLAFQISMMNALLDKSMGKKGIKIQFQSLEKTNKKLEDNGISIRDSWKLESDKLAQITGTDAVVKMRVIKQRYMSDLASYGIDLARDVIHILTNYSLWIFTPGGLSKTNDIKAECSLFNSADGELLWKMAVEREADWSRPANEVIDYLTHKFARNFPYRK